MSTAREATSQELLVELVGSIPPLPDSGSRRRTGREVHAHLRDLIVSGKLAPGTQLAQAEVARTLGVSRSPLREAFRMLEQEDLIIAEPDQRPVVAPVDVSEQDSIWAIRLVTESLAARMAADSLTEASLAELESVLERMRSALLEDNHDLWVRSHESFHDIVDIPAGYALNHLVRTLCDRTTRYMAAHDLPIPHSKPEALDDHVAIYAALRDRDAGRAGHAAALHIGRPALFILAHVAPKFESRAVRLALNGFGIDADELA